MKLLKLSTLPILDLFLHSGALKAAKFIVNQEPGLYNMDNLVN